MIKRSFQLYNEGGSKEVFFGAKRLYRNKKRNILVFLLQRSNNPKRALYKYITIRRQLQPNKYTKAEPFKITYVDPNSIHNRVVDIPTAWGRVVGGKWRSIPFEHVDVHGAPLHESNVLHFVEGVPWKDTPAYRARMDAIGSGPRSLASAKEVEYYFETLDKIFDSMKRDGYLCQSDLLNRDKNTTLKNNNDEVHPLLNEVGINIGRNGELLWSRCGKHRLSFAKILDFDQIPVQVRTRHIDWERLRREVLENKTQNLQTHPDLIDLEQRI